MEMEYREDAFYPYVSLASPSPSSLRATKRLARQGTDELFNRVLQKKLCNTGPLLHADSSKLILDEIKSLSSICEGANNKASTCQELLTSLCDEVNGETSEDASMKETILISSEAILEKSNKIHEDLLGKTAEFELGQKALADIVEGLQFETIQQFYLSNRETKIEFECVKKDLECLKKELVSIKVGMNRLMATMTLFMNNF